LRFHFERFISARRRHVMALRCRIEHLAGPPAELRFLAPLDADVRTNGFDHFTAVEITGEHEPITLAVRTNSGVTVGAAALVTSDLGVPLSVEVQPRWVALCGTVIAEAGRPVVLDKFAALTSSHHVPGPPVDVARKLVWDAAAAGFERLGEEHDAVWRERWERTDVVIEGDPASQLALRVSLYHMLRAVSEDDPRCAIDAKAAAGEAYCGRYFWDTEIFMLPLFLYTRPEVGKTLARFRVASLGGARRNAERYGYPGARYAWESAPSGDENCPNWQYADHEVHVTADVAYGLWHAHLCNPHDRRFFRDCVGVFVETALYWAERVTYDAEHDRYEMLLVMGPDEYTPFSRNNAYTNRLAAFALRLAAESWERLGREDPSAAGELRDRLTLGDGEPARWLEIASKLRIPYDAARKLVLQSDDFFDYEPFDFGRYWPDRTKRLAAVVSQERLYRSQVLKQGDVVQLMALFPQEYDDAQVRAAYDMYEPLTSHDSSLSKSMHALVAQRFGRHEAAYRFWQESAGLDLQPGEAAEGIHAACAGANWQVAILGFAGLRTRVQSEVLALDPHLPGAWTALRFPLVWEGQRLYVSIDRPASAAAGAGMGVAERAPSPAGSGQPSATGAAERITIEHRGDHTLTARIRGVEVVIGPRTTWTDAGGRVPE
ncbi:MAG: glycosyl hydrolase family 65 protein, partial [Planctomycetota bacterium]